MCGIAGIVSLNSKAPSNLSGRAEKMSKMLNHRGPDYRGVWMAKDKSIALVNTRLSIVDPNNNFSVPFSSSSGNSVLAYNGEIYNYKELYDFLISKGINFKTKSDTEIMVEGIEKYGLDFIKKIDGFCSIAFLDIVNNKLVLARDLIGEKSLFYFLDKNELIFCSEIAPIIAVMESLPLMDYDELYTAFKYRAASPGKSLVKNIDRLLGGEAMFIDLNSKEISKRFIQDFKLDNWLDFFSSDPSEQRVLDAYEENLYNAIKSRIPREVSFSATLSGGIDSALIGIFSSDYSQNKIKTIYAHSTDFPPIRKGDTLNEFEASKVSSRYISEQHDDFSMFDDDAINNYSIAAKNSFDGLFCEGLPSFAILAQFNKKLGRKVLLLSDGPDDLIGGYEIDKKLCEDSEGLNINKINETNKSYKLKSNDLKRNFNLNNYKFNPFNFNTIHGGTSDSALKNIFSESDFIEPPNVYGRIPVRLENVIGNLDVSQRMALSYASYSLPDHFNLRIDRGTMMHSVEPRVPFQAISLVNMMIATPMKWRYKNNTTKYLLRKIVEKHIGKKIAFRKKYGFAQPLWKNKHINRKLKMEEVVDSSNMWDNKIFNNNVKKFLMKESQKTNKRHLWMAYCTILSEKHMKELKSLK